MKRKILDINEAGKHIICIKDDATEVNPYRTYIVWYDQGWHRRILAKHQDFISVISLTKTLYSIY